MSKSFSDVKQNKDMKTGLELVLTSYLDATRGFSSLFHADGRKLALNSLSSLQQNKNGCNDLKNCYLEIETILNSSSLTLKNTIANILAEFPEFHIDETSMILIAAHSASVKLVATWDDSDTISGAQKAAAKREHGSRLDSILLLACGMPLTVEQQRLLPQPMNAEQALHFLKQDSFVQNEFAEAKAKLILQLVTKANNKIGFKL